MSTHNLQNIQIPYALDVDSSTGAAIGSVGIPVSEARNGFQPALSLNYNSSFKNSIFGRGWTLSGLSFICLDVAKGIPKYQGDEKYLLNGSQKIVPHLEKPGQDWVQKIEETAEYFIYYYRAQQEDSFARIEKWIKKSNLDVHWKIRSKENQVSVFGKASNNTSRIIDPENNHKIFKWLIEDQYDAQGNAIHYTYKSEDGAGIDSQTTYENRRLEKFTQTGFAQKYPERIQYGNTVALKSEAPKPANNKWCFEIVFDYGEYDITKFDSNIAAAGKQWDLRPDPFSQYGTAFEIRTYRLCKHIIQFHHFAELSNKPSATGFLSCGYQKDALSSNLMQVHYTGVRKELGTGTYISKQIPPVTFNYSKPIIGTSFTPAVKDTNENVPAGINDRGTRLIDLFGDGMPGILKNTKSAWYYKRNLGGGNFGDQEIVINKPSTNLGNYTLGDYNRDGNLKLYAFQGRTAGHYTYDKASQKWTGFTPFKRIPQVAHGQFLDLNSDGFPDLLVDRDDKIVFYKFDGEEGFDAPQEIYKNKSSDDTYSPIIGSDLQLDFLLADMTGDGLLDQVQIANGRVIYYPNLGNGKYGEIIVMENAPMIEFGHNFDASKLRLYDLNGTGTSDLIYLGNGEIRYWYNASGNQFLEGEVISNLPYMDNLSRAQIFDFLGNGTPCLVWSNSINHSNQESIQYLELTSNIKPGLITSMENSMGNEVKLEYGYSAEHYLEMLTSDDPWISHCPNHFTVVNKKIVFDKITNNSFSTEFKYRNAQYNGRQRRFICFGLVEEYDTEIIDNPAIVDFSEFVQASCLKTWYHSGSVNWNKNREKQFYLADDKQAFLVPQNFEQMDALHLHEFEFGYRTLAGKIIRKEMYAMDEQGDILEHALKVNQYAYVIRNLQPGAEKDGISMYTYLSESLAYDYQQNPSDPRIQHHISVEINPYGEITKELSIAYARRANPLAVAAQSKDIITASIHNYATRDTIEEYNTTILLEGKDYELNGISHPVNTLVSRLDVMSQFDNWISNAKEFDEQLGTGAATEARLISFLRTFYYNDAMDDVLALGQLGKRIVAHHEEQACFNDNFTAGVYGGKLTNGMKQNTLEGNYIQKDGYWWKQTAINHFRAESEFTILDKVEHAPGVFTTYKYDPYFLNVIEIIFPDGSKESGVIDYNVVDSFRQIDKNDNISEVIFDALGVSVATFNKGTVLDDANTPQAYGVELSDQYVRQNDESFDNLLSNPTKYLQKANSFIYYDLENFQATGNPLRAISLVRENLMHDGFGNVDNASEIGIGISYTDGVGRPIQKKSKVEAGPAIKRDGSGQIVLLASGEVELQDSVERWLVSGHTIYNNKALPIQTFEPYFSPLHTYESETKLTHFGVSSQIFYDAFGRQLRTLYPNLTFSEIEYGSWEQKVFDQNDTVENSIYKTVREILPTADPERLALDKALQHKDTPVVTILDPMGRDVITIEKNNDGTERREEQTLDINGAPVAVKDARTLLAFEYKYDMLGRLVFEKSIDSGEKWSFADYNDQLIHTWDGRNVHTQFVLDNLRRVDHVKVNGALGMSHMTEKFVYWDDASVTQAKEKNIVGLAERHFDQAGIQIAIKNNTAGMPLKLSKEIIDASSLKPDWTNPAAVSMDGNTHLTEQRYDGMGRVQLQKLADGTLRKFVFSKGGSLKKILFSSADGTIQDLEILKDAEYNSKGMRSMSLLGNNVAINYNYDANTFRLAGLKAQRTSGTSKVYQDISYHYDPVGNLVHLNDIARSNSAASPKIMTGMNVSGHSEYTYDALYRLTQATGRVHQALEKHDYRNRANQANTPVSWKKGTRHIALNNAAAVERYTRSYTYDLSGNRVSVGHQATTKNWTKDNWTSATSNRSLSKKDLNGVNVTNPESRFDANGNCIYQAHLRDIVWNHKNQLEKVVVIDRSAQAQPNDEEIYIYNNDGMRVKKITQKLVDTTNNIIEITEKTYLGLCEFKKIIRGTTTILSRSTSKVSDGQNKIALIHNWTIDTSQRETDNPGTHKIHYQLHNHLGSSALELDASGDVITYEEYFPFGGTSFMAGRSDREIDIKDYRYTGKERDDFSGLYYYGYRYYAHWIGSWLSADPIGAQDGLNLYAFVHNNPINLVDPNGLQSKLVIPGTPGDRLTARSTFAQRQAFASRHGYRLVEPNPDQMRFVNGSWEASPQGRLINLRADPKWQEFRDTGMSEERADSIMSLLSIMTEGMQGVTQQGTGGTDENESENNDGETGNNEDETENTGEESSDDETSQDSGDSGEDDSGTGGTGEIGTGTGSGTQGTGTGGGGTDETTTPGNQSGGNGQGTGRGNGTGDGTGNGTTPGGRAGGTGTSGSNPGTGTGNTNGSRTGSNTGSSNRGSSGRGTGTNPNATGTAPGAGGTATQGGGTSQGAGSDQGAATGNAQGSIHGSEEGTMTTDDMNAPSGTGDGGNTSGEHSGDSDSNGSQDGGNGQEQQQGDPRSNWMDDLTTVAGYFNLEFGSDNPNGEAGGIPGGMDLLGWRPPMWVRRTIQGVYIAATVITTVIPIGKALMGAKLAATAAIKGVSALGRRALTAVVRRLPTRAGMRALVQRGRGLIARMLTRNPAAAKAMAASGASSSGAASIPVRIMRRIMFGRNPNIPYARAVMTDLGGTSASGAITMAQRLVPGSSQFMTTLMHEGTHRFFTPLGNSALARFRQNIGHSAYWKSQLLRFTEEGLAQTVGSGTFRSGFGWIIRHVDSGSVYKLTTKGLALEALRVTTVIGGGAAGIWYATSDSSDDDSSSP